MAFFVCKNAHLPMLEWNDLSVILAVGRAGTLSGAARHLGLNHSTVFRKVNAIEERASVRFFDRLQSGYRLTEAGEAAVACAERIESEVHALGREILGQDTRLQGHVRVTAMEGLASLVLPAPLAEFSRLHPGLAIEIVGTAATLDLTRREAEVAVRATRKPPESAFGRKICKFRFGIYSASSYIDGREHDPLGRLDWCHLQGIEAWLVPAVFKKRKDVDEHTVMTGSSIVSVVEAVAAGAGVTMLPTYVGEADERLVRVGELLDPLTLDLWLLTHPDLRHTARVRALMEFLYEVLLERRDVFEGVSRD
jgi:DNA-binding transcriptional LysR family regulator